MSNVDQITEARITIANELREIRTTVMNLLNSTTSNIKDYVVSMPNNILTKMDTTTNNYKTCGMFNCDFYSDKATAQKVAVKLRNDFGQAIVITYEESLQKYLSELDSILNACF